MCLINCAGKYNDELAKEFIDEMHEVCVFRDLRDKDHTLPQRGHRLIFVGLDADTCSGLKASLVMQGIWERAYVGDL